MAKVVVYFRFADGDTIQAIASGETSYPDALAQLRAEAVKAFQESLTFAMVMQTPKVEAADE